VAYRDDRIIAVAVLDSFTVIGCNAHFAIDEPIVLRHGFFEAVAELCFITNGKKKMFGLVPSNNERAVKLDKHIGFEIVTEIPETIEDGVGTIVMVLTREAAKRWLPNHQEAA